jgi:hypothetical protein
MESEQEKTMDQRNIRQVREFTTEDSPPQENKLIRAP